MKSWKKLLVLLLALTMVFAFTACGGSDQADDQTADDQQAEEPADEQAEEPAETPDGQAADASASGIPDYVYVEVNGTKIIPGGNYADIEGKIGDETKPSERIEPCDPDAESADQEYYFDGYSLTTVADTGLIRMIDVDQSLGEGKDALLAGKLPLGCTVDEVKAIFGEPGANELDNEDESFLQYYYGEDDGMIMFYKDEEGNNTITGYIMSFNDMK